jgi:3-hydroxyisobutyrate dehydrogenase-like beta-hydroxyacid dehydrogenase
MQVRLIGLGANNLLKAGFALNDYNRNSAKTKALAAKGASR